MKCSNVHIISPQFITCRSLRKWVLIQSYQQFRKFLIDWKVFTRKTDMPTSQTSMQLYSGADELVQNAIIITYSKFFTTDPDRLLVMIESLVAQRSNPMVHWIPFTPISQHEDEPIKQYLVHLRATATDCNFFCLTFTSRTNFSEG